jgi:hypothetical protein
MTEGNFFQTEVDGLADASDFNIDPSTAGTGAVEIHSIVHGGAADVKFEIDPDGDGTYEITETIDSVSGAGISQQNKIEISDTNNSRLTITNTSGGAADYAVTGVEITD